MSGHGHLPAGGGCSSEPSDEVTTHGCGMNARMPSSLMLKEAAAVNRSSERIMRNAASTGAICHCMAIADFQRAYADLIASPRKCLAARAVSTL